jgi:Fic family protein
MSESDLPEAAPGRYVPFGARPYYMPDELPPETDVEIDAEFRGILEDAIYQLGQLEGVSEETDTNPIVYTSLVRREAVESVLIEGAEISIEDLFRPKQIQGAEVTKDVREGLNYERAVYHGADRVQATGHITTDLLKELHALLLEDARDEGDTLGEYRSKPVHIPPPEALSEPFIPPAPNAVPNLMANLETFLQTGSDNHDLVDAGLVHYQFETIHPFSDSNGRLGRVLITLQLIDQGYLSQPYLYPSAYFNEHKVEYVRRMRAVSEEGAWESWLQFFVDGIRQQAADAVARTDELRSLRREYEQEFGHEKTATDRLAMRLFEHPYVTTKDVVDMLDVSDQTARSAIIELESQGVLEETTGKDRYQEFKAVDIFEILTRSFE